MIQRTIFLFKDWKTSFTGTTTTTVYRLTNTCQYHQQASYWSKCDDATDTMARLYCQTMH